MFIKAYAKNTGGGGRSGAGQSGTTANRGATRNIGGRQVRPIGTASRNAIQNARTTNATVNRTGGRLVVPGTPRRNSGARRAGQ